MFPSHEKAQQLLEQAKAVIGGAAIELPVLTHPMVALIEAQVRSEVSEVTVVHTVAFSARRVNEEVLWTFFRSMIVNGVRFARGDSVTDLGERLRLMPKGHVSRAYSLCDGPLKAHFVCIRKTSMSLVKHRVEAHGRLFVYHPTGSEVEIFRDPDATQGVKDLGRWRAFACASVVIPKNDAESQ